MVAVFRCSDKDVEYPRLRVGLLDVVAEHLESMFFEQDCLENETKAAKYGLPIPADPSCLPTITSLSAAGIILKVGELIELFAFRCTRMILKGTPPYFV
jgi:hypothetical protein